MPLYDTRKEPGFTASDRAALMTMIPMSAVGQKANLWLIPRFEEGRSPTIPPRTRQVTDHDKSAD
jgi:hypothetical protein